MIPTIPNKTQLKQLEKKCANEKKMKKKKITCTRRINNGAKATTLKTFKSANRILFPIQQIFPICKKRKVTIKDLKKSETNRNKKIKWNAQRGKKTVGRENILCGAHTHTHPHQVQNMQKLRLLP